MSSQGRRTRSATAQIISDSASEAVKLQPPKVEAANGVDPKVTELERRLAITTKERDDLARDVESLCMQSGSSIFDGSMVLSERIFAAERDLSNTKAQLSAVTEERNNLREDLRAHKDSKRSVDTGWRVERERAERLEKELQFYQSQSAKAMAERDQAAWEAEELKRNTLAMESRLSQAESRAETAAAEQGELEAQLSEATRRIKDLEVKARECETIPGLWKHIAENTKQIKSMEIAHEALERSLSSAKSDTHEAKDAVAEAQQKLARAEAELEETRAEAHAESQAAAAKIKSLEARIEELEEAAVSLELRVDEAEGSLAAAQAEVETTTTTCNQQLAELRAETSAKLTHAQSSHIAEVTPLRKELESVKGKLQHMTAEFDQARAEKVQALLRVSQAEQTAEQGFEETGRMLDQVNDLKDRVTQATQEKVAALMQVADLREQLRTAGRSSGGGASLHSRASGWRLWGVGPASTEAAEAESLPNGGSKGDPQDLKEAIDQLRGLNERMAELETLASSIQDLRQQLEDVRKTLSTTPTHLRRKEIAKTLTALASEAQGLDEKHADALKAAAAQKDALGKEDPEKGPREKLKPGGDSAAAAELLLMLRLAVETLQQHSSPEWLRQDQESSKP